VSEKGLARLTDGRGFTLIEALVAMAVFAIGSLMVIPTIFAWVQANNLSLQRDAAGRIMDSQSAGLSQMAPDQAPWTDIVNTAGNYQAARGILDSLTPSGLTDLGTAAGFATPVSRPSLGMTASVTYAVVGITDSGGNMLSRVMRLRVSWNGPAGSTHAEERLLQRR